MLVVPSLLMAKVNTIMIENCITASMLLKLYSAQVLPTNTIYSQLEDEIRQKKTLKNFNFAMFLHFIFTINVNKAQLH